MVVDHTVKVKGNLPMEVSSSSALRRVMNKRKESSICKSDKDFVLF
jgi:hypothetical protein